MGFGRADREFELVLRVLVASPWMLERFLSTSRSGIVDVGGRGRYMRCGAQGRFSVSSENVEKVGRLEVSSSSSAWKPWAGQTDNAGHEW